MANSSPSVMQMFRQPDILSAGSNFNLLQPKGREIPLDLHTCSLVKYNYSYDGNALKSCRYLYISNRVYKKASEYLNYVKHAKETLKDTINSALQIIYLLPSACRSDPMKPKVLPPLQFDPLHFSALDSY